MKKFNFLKEKNLVYILLLIGFFLRLSNINWGAPFYFHPDERNIASLLSLSPFENFPSYFLKGTFSYGNFLTIVLQIPKLLIMFFYHKINTFILSTLILRYTEVIFSTLTLFAIYKTGNLFSKNVGIIALSLSVFSVGFIQNSRFGTFDTFITFFIFLSLYFSLLIIKARKIKYFYFALISICLACSAKLTSITFAPIIFLSLFFVFKNKKISPIKIFLTLIIGALILLTTFILSPYYLTHDFLNLLQYERELVTGSLPVFYTQSFKNTIPIIYQLTDIFPFLINPFNTLLLFISFLFLVFKLFNNFDKKILILILGFLVLFIPQSVLFAKWSRYLLPTLPLSYITIGIFLSSLVKNKKRVYKNLSIVLISITILFSAIHAFAFLVETKESSAINASIWAKNNISKDSTILSEQYDLGVTAFNRFFSNITLFDFYNLEDSKALQEELSLLYKNSEYIILPSQRILKSRLLLPSSFPKGNKFYSDLYFGKSSFRKIYETPCSIWCKLLYLGDPILRLEETTSVFDRPTVTIYKKIND